MFITNNANRSAFSNLCGESEQTYWRAAELGLHIPWFIVTVIHHPVGDDDSCGMSYSRTIFLCSIDDVIELAKAASPSCDVESVLVVTPSHINRSDDWQMESLRTVWTAVEPAADGVVVEIFETNSGALHYQSHFETPFQNFRDRTIKFQFTREASEQDQPIH